MGIIPIEFPEGALLGLFCFVFIEDQQCLDWTTEFAGATWSKQRYSYIMQNQLLKASCDQTRAIDAESMLGHISFNNHIKNTDILPQQPLS